MNYENLERPWDPDQRGSVSRLATGIAHDFNNMLTVISMSAQLMLGRSGCDDDESRADLLLILEAAGRGEAVARQLLDRRGGRVATPRVVRPAAIIGDLSPLLRRLLGPSIDLVVRTAVECSANIDVGQLERVIVNLAMNGRDAMGTRGTLTIATRCDHEVVDELTVSPATPSVHHVVIAIADTGSGMDPAICRRIFEPYFTTKESGSGTGLGLAIIREIVMTARGGLDVASVPGVGTVMSVYLPCHEHGAAD